MKVRIEHFLDKELVILHLTDHFFRYGKHTLPKKLSTRSAITIVKDQLFWYGRYGEYAEIGIGEDHEEEYATIEAWVTEWVNVNFSNLK